MDRNYFTFTRADAPALGCALALLATSRFRHVLVVRQSMAMCLSIIALIILVAIKTFTLHDHHHLTIFFTAFVYRFIVEWCVVVLVWGCVYSPQSLYGRMVNWRPLVVLGMLSYSIYLWQQPFLGSILPLWLFKFPANLVIIAILACGSYYFVEQPFLRLKARFERTKDARLRSEFEAARLEPIPAT
jgi:peptidoglycan/LPS O-acetylase OafA/YrhL